MPNIVNKNQSTSSIFQIIGETIHVILFNSVPSTIYLLNTYNHCGEQSPAFHQTGEREIKDRE
jgi:hypothetical protein